MKPAATPLPANTLLARLALARGAFADAYTVQVPRTVTLAEFVEAFYTTRLYRLEHAVLALVGRPPGDCSVSARRPCR